MSLVQTGARVNGRSYTTPLPDDVATILAKLATNNCDLEALRAQVLDLPALTLSAILQRDPLAEPVDGLAKLGIVNLVEFMARVFPPRKNIIPGLRDEGAGFTAAKSKVGKSILEYDLALAVAYGGMALGSIKVEQGPVLYLDLEMGQGLSQARWRDVLEGQAPPSTLEVVHRWPTLFEGGLDQLRQWLRDHSGARLIVIDTVKRIRPPERPGISLYGQDYDYTAPLGDLAHEFNVAIDLVHHLRKADSDDPLDLLSGSTGLGAAVDHVTVLKRGRASNEGVMHVVNRTAADQQLAVEFRYPHWRILGDLETVKKSEERKHVIEFFRGIFPQWLGPKEAADAIGINYSTMKGLVIRMAADGDLETMSGKYRAPNGK